MADNNEAQEPSILEGIQALMDAGNAIEAIGLAKQHIAEYPEDPIGQYAMAQVLIHIGQIQDALGFARQAKQLDNQNPSYSNMVGLILRLSGRFKEAAELFNKLVQSYPDYAEAWNNFGLCLSDLKQYKMAEEAFVKAIDIHSEFAEAWNNLGSMRFAQKRFPESMSCFDRAISIRPEYAEAWLNRGELLAQDSKHYKEALKSFRRAVELRPSHLDSWYRLCHFLYLCHEYQQAIEVGIRILEVNPNHFETLQNMAASCDKLGEHQRSTIYLRQILSFKPNHMPSLLNLAKKALVLGAPIEALAIAEQAKIQAPHEPAIFHLIGLCLTKLLRVEDALKSFGVANRLSPDNPHTLNAIGELLLLTGQLKAGYRTREARLKIPNYPLAYRAVEMQGRIWNANSQLEQRRLLIIGEGNAREDILYLRYIPEIRKNWPQIGAVMLVTSQDFAHMVRGNYGLDKVFDSENLPRASEYDLFIPLSSLPLKFDSEVKSIPWQGAYLTDLKEPKFIPPRSHEFALRIGLSLQPEAIEMDKTYSTLAISMFHKAFADSTIGFYILQQSNNALENRRIAEFAKVYKNIIILPDNQETMVDQARLIGALDLVISIDNRFAMLAGAMGIPCWVMLDFVPNFHWGANKVFANDRSPWFPDTRLFRQKLMGDWSLPLKEINKGILGLLKGQEPEDYEQS